MIANSVNNVSNKRIKSDIVPGKLQNNDHPKKATLSTKSSTKIKIKSSNINNKRNKELRVALSIRAKEKTMREGGVRPKDSKAKGRVEDNDYQALLDSPANSDLGTNRVLQQSVSV